MQVASRREVTALGRTLEVLHTSMFEGRADEVDVVMLPGDGVHTRVVFRACGDVEIDGWLGALRPADGAPDPEAAARARAIQTAEAFVRAQGYTDVAPTVPDDEIVHEGIEGSVAMRRHQLAPRAVRADGRAGRWMVVFRYQDPQYAGRGRAVQLTAGETPRLIHQDLVLGPP